MNKAEMIGLIKLLEADINDKKEKLNELKAEACLKGFAQWVYTNNGQLIQKAPSVAWWKQHRAKTYETLSAKTLDLPQIVNARGKLVDDPEHLAFWKKPSKTFSY